MAKLSPLRGVRYNTGKIDNPSGVLAPPYDIISADAKEKLYTQSPYNIVQIDFGKDFPGDSDAENRYTRSAAFLREWMASGILVRDERPAYYCYEVEYSMGGERLKFRGLLGMVGIEPFEAGVVLPHEETHSKPKSDRLNLLRATNANISPIFSLYSGERKITSGILASVAETASPLIEGADSLGSIHRMWRVDDPAGIAAISDEMADKKIFIADGHHRYETSLAHMNETGGRASRVLMFLANMEEPGLTVLPTHRLIRSLPGDAVARLKTAFSVLETDAADPASLLAEIARRANNHSFGFYAGGKGYVIEIERGSFTDAPQPLGSLDVTVLHRLIMEKTLGVQEFAYEMDAAVSMRMVDESRYDATFLLNPTRLHELRDVALAGRRMPPKSTYFYPKLMTGMVISMLDE
ncbi:MAG: DUF1015 domain-containing protein [Nitrospirae bacterium]|nr:DUF1015 domain-containing protein [Nitrospirota bacterium]